MNNRILFLRFVTPDIVLNTILKEDGISLRMKAVKINLFNMNFKTFASQTSLDLDYNFKHQAANTSSLK